MNPLSNSSFFHLKVRSYNEKIDQQEEFLLPIRMHHQQKDKVWVDNNYNGVMDDVRVAVQENMDRFSKEGNKQLAFMKIVGKHISMAFASIVSDPYSIVGFNEGGFAESLSVAKYQLIVYVFPLQDDHAIMSLLVDEYFI